MANPNVKSPIWYGFGGAHWLKHPMAGTAYYVSNAGDDANDGLTPNTPFLTITHALTLVSGTEDDYIFVKSVSHADETWPIALDTHYVHLIGDPGAHSTGGGQTVEPLILADTNNHGIEVTAWGVEIAGFNFGNTVINQKADIHLDASWGVHIHHNTFAWSTESYNCILVSNLAVNTSIHDNYFGCHGFSNYAISGSAGRINIECNVFFMQGRIVTGVGAINLGLNFGGVIKDNVFRCRDNAAGEAIIVGGQNGLITGNFAMSGVAANMTNNPYQEDGASHWGLNYDNQTARLPA